jgi:hypothetical protein
MRYPMITGILMASALSLPVLAQVTPQEQEVTLSQAGAVSRTQLVRESVVVMSIDKTARRLLLKKADGQVLEVIAGDEVRNFDQIRLNDEVVVEYSRSLSLTLRKVRTEDTQIIEDAEALRASAGEKPGGAVVRSVSAIADVVAVNPDKSTISLKGPEGRVFELDVKNPDHFKVVKVGDQVLVYYTEAVAVSVQSATASAPKK